jgi:hypothetical protein
MSTEGEKGKYGRWGWKRGKLDGECGIYKLHKIWGEKCMFIILCIQ